MQLEKKFEAEEELPSPTTRVVEGESVGRLFAETSSKIEGRLCFAGGRDLPQVIAETEPTHTLFSDLKDRKVRLQFVTEITVDNIAQCKKLVEELGIEMRHLDAVKGSFAVSKDQFWTTARIPQNGVHIQLLWSSVPAIVEQNDFVFNSLWEKALPAEARFREIDEGIHPTETKVIYNPEEIINEIKRACKTSIRSLSFCTDSENLVQGSILLLDSYKIALQNHRSRVEDSGFRWIVQIESGEDEQKKKEIIRAVKNLLDLGVKIRHTDSPPMLKFALKDSEELYATFESGLEDRIVLNVLFSNEQAYVKQFEAVFEESWRKSRDARERIKELQEGIEVDRTEIVEDVSEAAGIAKECFLKCEKEILIILASEQVIARNLTLYQEMIEASARRNIKVRMLVPAKNSDFPKFLEKVDWRAIDEMNVGYAIYDRKKMLITQYSRAGDRAKIPDKIQANIFTTNREHISGIVSVFDALWRESELRQVAERSRRRAELFQDILSHDLRNHLQVIELDAEQIQEEVRDNKDLEPIIENLLQALERSTTLLDRTRQLGKLISEKNLKLHDVDLLDALERSIELVKKANPEKYLEYAIHSSDANFVVRADDMLSEVFTNIFTNSVKYTELKNVKIEASVVTDGKVPDEYWKISIADWGSGIMPETKDRIFDRYMGSAKGTGLGLSIVHALVVDRYKGRIEVKDRAQGNRAAGTVVELWLPKASIGQN